jgi:hypothetical protein
MLLLNEKVKQKKKFLLQKVGKTFVRVSKRHYICSVNNKMTQAQKEI